MRCCRPSKSAMSGNRSIGARAAETICGEIERSVEPAIQQLELPLGEDRISDVEGEELCSK